MPCVVFAQVSFRDKDTTVFDPEKSLVLCLVPTKDARRRDDPLLPSRLMCTLLRTDPSCWQHVEGVHMLRPARTAFSSDTLPRDPEGRLRQACTRREPIPFAAQLHTRNVMGYSGYSGFQRVALECRQFVAEMPDPGGQAAEDYILLQGLAGG